MRAIDYFDKSAEAQPGRVAVIDGDAQYTYREVRAITERIARAMWADGLKGEQCAAIYSHNDARVLFCMLGIMRAGAVWVPMNYRNAVDANVEYLNYVETAWLFYHSNFKESVAEIATRVPSLKHMVCIDAEDGDHPSLETFMNSEDTATELDWADTYGNMNPKISPEFFNQVQAAIGQVEAKYPAGAAFAKAQAADYQHRAEALNELMRRPVKSRAEASVLYFAAAYYDLQAQAQSSARANASVSRAGRALYQQIAGAMAEGTTPPTLPGDLDAGQVAQLRRLALGLSQDAGPEFLRHYNLLFRSELGPLTAYDQAPGVTGPVAGAA